MKSAPPPPGASLTPDRWAATESWSRSITATALHPLRAYVQSLVEEGQDVVEGAVLGRIGSSGRSTGPHLHYEVRVDGEPVDPERYLRAGRRSRGV